MNIVLFCGAGFSTICKLPVMNSFFDAASKLDTLDKDEQSFLRDLRSRARNASSMIAIADENLEDVLSFALMDAELSPEPEKERSKDQFDRLCVILRKVYSRFPRGDWIKPLATAIRSILRFDESWPHELSIITTNYDLVAEIGLKAIGLTPHLPCAFEPVHPDQRAVHGRLYSKNYGKVQICKLHGSLNWSCSDGNDTLEVDDGVFSDASAGPEYAMIPQACVPSYEPEYVPLIVPPTYTKLKQAPVVHEMWRAAWLALNQADAVAFIGYSFPSSDTYMTYFVASALVKNLEIKHVDIIDPNGDEIIAKLKSPKARMGHGFTTRLRSFNHDWPGKYNVLKAAR